MHAWMVIIGGLVFIIAVILLEYLSRRVFNGQPESEKWKWDKYDTLITVIITIVTFIAIAIILSKHQTIEISTRWPLQSSDLISSQTPLQTNFKSPPSMLDNRKVNSGFSSEGLFPDQSFKVSSPSSSYFGTPPIQQTPYSHIGSSPRGSMVSGPPISSPYTSQPIQSSYISPAPSYSPIQSQQVPSIASDRSTQGPLIASPALPSPFEV